MSALSVAKQRLREKEHEVKEQVGITVAFRDDVIARNSRLSTSLSRRCEYLHDQFNSLHHALEQKEKDLLNHLNSETVKAGTFNGKLVDSIDDLVDKAEKVCDYLNYIGSLNNCGPTSCICSGI